MSETAAPGGMPTAARSASSPLPEVPGPLARRFLAFEFLVLVEFWLAPLFLGVTNYAGIWSDVGVALFVLFVSTLSVLVLRPLRPHLQLATATRRDRMVFHSLWLGVLVAALFVTNTFQLGSGPTSGPVAFAWSTVYTPFGAWPTLTAYVPPIQLFATGNVEILTVLALLSFLGSSAIRLVALQNLRSCSAERALPARWGRRAVALAVWTPLGFITGCSACAPLYLAAVGAIAPTVVAGGLSDIPLVPWIGFAGLLYLTSFGLALDLIRRATTSRTAPVPVPSGATP